MSERQRVKGTFCSFKSSHSGKALLNVYYVWEQRNHKMKYTHLELEIDRSSIWCIIHALKQFVDNERKEIAALPL